MLLLQALGDFRRDAGHQNVARFRQKGRGDRRDLIGGLAGSENHLGHAMTQRAMVIDLREAQIFKRQVAQAVERGVDVHGSGAHLFEQRAQVVLIHRKFQDSSGGEAFRQVTQYFPRVAGIAQNPVGLAAPARHLQRYPQKRLYQPP